MRCLKQNRRQNSQTRAYLCAEEEEEEEGKEGQKEEELRNVYSVARGISVLLYEYKVVL
jgi:hypothetical protein